MKVSIGLPFYNNRTTLSDAIRSVFAQTAGDWELILVDDGSTDGSSEVARSVRDARVRVIGDGVNRGLSERLNQIAHVAQGQYLARMDGDDLMHPERIAYQIAVLDRRLDVELVGTAMYSLDCTDKPRGVRCLVPPDRSPSGVLKRSPLAHATVMGRTDWFRRHPYDGTCRRAEDHELFVRTVRDLRFAHVPEPLYFVREEQPNRLGKYLASCRDDQAIFRTYGPELVGERQAMALCLRSVLKGEIYRAFSYLGLEHLLVRRRNTPLTVAQVAAAMDVLVKIRATAVPGLPSCPESFQHHESNEGSKEMPQIRSAPAPGCR